VEAVFEANEVFFCLLVFECVPKASSLALGVGDDGLVEAIVLFAEDVHIRSRLQRESEHHEGGLQRVNVTGCGRASGWSAWDKGLAFSDGHLGCLSPTCNP
jgi:hypothetical protein